MWLFETQKKHLKLQARSTCKSFVRGKLRGVSGTWGGMSGELGEHADKELVPLRAVFAVIGPTSETKVLIGISVRDKHGER